MFAKLTQQPWQRRRTDRSALFDPWRYEVALPDFGHLLENGNSAIRQWHTVLPSCLYPCRSDYPHALLQVDLIPARPNGLARTRCGENHEFECSRGYNASALVEPNDKIW